MYSQIMPQQTFSGISGGGELPLYQFFISSPLFAEFKDLGNSAHKIFLAQFINLAPALKDYLSSIETAMTILLTAENYELSESQTSKIAGTIRELILGKIFIKDFPITISSKLGIDDIKAGEIANKIISKSFGPIIEDLKRIQRAKFPDKIMELRKESQPQGLGPVKMPVPEGIKDVPLQKPSTINRQQIMANRQSLTDNSQQATTESDKALIQKPSFATQTPTVRPPPTSPRPPLQQTRPPVENIQTPKPGTNVRPQQSKQFENRPPLPFPGRENQILQSKTKSLEPKNLFRIPDLGQPISSEQKPAANGDDAKKSLEDELEKVAGVIDLRTRSKNQNDNE